MKLKFKVPVRVDATKAQDGVWFNIEVSGLSYGSYKARYLDQFSTKVDTELQRIRDAIDAKTMSEAEQGLELLVWALQDWKGIVDENDKPIPFSKEAAREYFSYDETTVVLVNLIQNVMNEKHFAPDSGSATVILGN